MVLPGGGYSLEEVEDPGAAEDEASSVAGALLVVSGGGYVLLELDCPGASEDEASPVEVLVSGGG